MAENIADHGAEPNPDDPSVSAARQNLDAVHAAANAAGQGGTIKIPDGEFYVGHGGGGPNMLIVFGAREPAGISIVGNGPDRSVLGVSRHIPTDTNHSLAYYWGNGTGHGTFSIDGVRLDGQWQAHGDMLQYKTGARGVVIRSGANGTFESSNAYYSGWYTMGIWNKGVSGTMTDCTFEACGLGVSRDSDGSFVSHGLGIDGVDGTFALERCLFRRCAGDAANLNSGSGTVVFRDCYGESLGNGVHKFQWGGTARHVRCFWEPHTDWLVQNMPNPSDKPPFYGRNFCHRLSANGSNPVMEFDNVEIRNTTFRAWWNADGNATFRGDMVALHRNAQQHRNHCISDGDNDPHSITFDFNRLSVHDTDGVIFNCPDSDGSISTLRHARNDGMGDTGSISIGSAESGAAPITPTVPSINDVGAGYEGTQDGHGPGGDTTAPPPDDGTDGQGPDGPSYIVGVGSSKDPYSLFEYEIVTGAKTVEPLSTAEVGGNDRIETRPDGTKRIVGRTGNGAVDEWRVYGPVESVGIVSVDPRAESDAHYWTLDGSEVTEQALVQQTSGDTDTSPDQPVQGASGGILAVGMLVGAIGIREYMKDRSDN